MLGEGHLEQDLHSFFLLGLPFLDLQEFFPLEV